MSAAQYSLTSAESWPRKQHSLWCCMFSKSEYVIIKFSSVIFLVYLCTTKLSGNHHVYWASWKTTGFFFLSIIQRCSMLWRKWGRSMDGKMDRGERDEMIRRFYSFLQILCQSFFLFAIFMLSIFCDFYV